MYSILILLTFLPSLITSTVTVSTFAGNGTAGSADGQGTLATFYNPYGIAIDSSGNLYVADYSKDKIRKITASGIVSTIAGSGAMGHSDGQGTLATFSGPSGIAVDSSGNLYVADSSNHNIRKIVVSSSSTSKSSSLLLVLSFSVLYILWL